MFEDDGKNNWNLITSRIKVFLADHHYFKSIGNLCMFQVIVNAPLDEILWTDWQQVKIRRNILASQGREFEKLPFLSCKTQSFWMRNY